MLKLYTKINLARCDILFLKMFSKKNTVVVVVYKKPFRYSILKKYFKNIVVIVINVIFSVVLGWYRNFLDHCPLWRRIYTKIVHTAKPIQSGLRFQLTGLSESRRQLQCAKQSCRHNPRVAQKKIPQFACRLTLQFSAGPARLSTAASPTQFAKQGTVRTETPLSAPANPSRRLLWRDCTL